MKRVIKRVGVIGSVNRDLVVQPDGSPTASLGGVLYTVLALAWLGHPEVEVWPILRLGRDAVEPALALLATVPGVRLDGVERVSRPAFRCELRYRPDGSKVERLTGNIEPLDPQRLDPRLAGLDGLLVNFITGYELRREDLPVLRQRLAGPRCPLLMDVHSLTLGRRRDGERYWRRPPRWRDWVGAAEVVQLNEAEASLLAGSGPAEPVDLDLLAEALLDCGPRAAVITRGPLGAVAYERSGTALRAYRSTAEEPGRAVDPTGCGDVFLAALALGWLRQEPLSEVVAWACRVAGAHSRIAGLAGMSALAELRRG